MSPMSYQHGGVLLQGDKTKVFGIRLALSGTFHSVTELVSSFKGEGEHSLQIN